MGKAIGIDLGTTNTAVAVLIDGRPRVLEDDKGYKVLPSTISLKPDGRFIVGQAARALIHTEPKNTVYAIKRIIGRRYDAPEVAHARKRVHYPIEPSADGMVSIRLGTELYSPSELSAVVLQVARSIAEKAIGEEVDEAVITVPAYFNHAQRNATMEAARLAGLRCERLLNEPTAAALAYGFRKDLDRSVVIYDLGGGTFDVSVLRLKRGVYEVLSTGGETWLGGEDFDFRLVDYLSDHFQNQTGQDPRRDTLTLQRVKDAAERAKCELSFTDRTTAMVPRLTASHNLELAVSRLTLESLVQDLIDRTVDITRAAVKDAGLQLSEVDDVILVGGQTRMPRVREAISALFQREPNRSVHPEEVVAIGAAVHANSLVESSSSAPILLDVTPFDLGIDVAGGLFQPVITRNSHVPASSGKIFATAHDNQSQVKVTVRQGDSRFSTENEFLGEFVMEGLTPGPRMSTKVEVTFRLDSSGLLQVTAAEPATGERKQITIRNYGEVARGEGQAQVDDGERPAGPLGVSAPRAVGVTGAPAAPAAPAPKAEKGGGISGMLRSLFGSKPKAPPAPPAPAPVPLPALAPLPADLADAPEELPAWAPLPSAPMPIFAEPVSLAAASLVPLDEPLQLDQSALIPLDEDDDEDEVSVRRVNVEPTGRGALGAGLDDDDGGGESIVPIGLGPVGGEEDDPFGSDPFASLPDDPFRKTPMPSREEAEEEDFAMPLDEEEGLSEENWDRSQAPRSPPPRPVSRPDDFDDPEITDIFRRRGRSEAGKLRRPARLKLAFGRADTMAAEYLDNLRKGGCFVKTDRPLPIGRDCQIELRAPGLEPPLVLDGVVTWSSADLPVLGPGQAPGMGIEYQMDERQYRDVQQRLQALMA